MKIIEKPWKYGIYLAYDGIDEEFLATEKGIRVLPAPFFYEKKLYFELKRRYEPGEKPTFPNGGYEVVNMSGGIHSYDLDQIIIHPQVLQHKKMLDKMARRAEKQAKKREHTVKKIGNDNKVKHGRRGRPAIDPVLKAARAASKVEAGVRSGGKRGRPKSTEPKAVSTPKISTGKLGRPALSVEAIKQRAADKAATTKRSGGKRGRPKSNR